MFFGVTHQRLYEIKAGIGTIDREHARTMIVWHTSLHPTKRAM